MVSVFYNIIRIASDLIDISTQLDSNPTPERRGGYVTWAPNNASVLYSARVGSITDPSKWDKYGAFSQEKVLRTQADFLRAPKTTVSSWQTRDIDFNRYGGGVIFNLSGSLDEPSDLISFSGLAEVVDEAVSLVIGHKFGLTSDDSMLADKVIRVSENRVYKELLDAYRGK